MDFEKMTIEELEARRLEIMAELDAEGADLDALEAEARAIKEEKENRKAAEEKRAAIRAAVASGAGEVVEAPAETEERAKTMTDKEIRSSAEYLDAWVEFQKGRASEEQRALLTENASNGTIAVPVYVEEKIHTAWENNEIIRRIRRSYYKGNLKVGVEVSAGDAVIHAEGSGAISEEELVLQYLELIPRFVKKKVQYSDEVLSLAGQTFVDYIFDEIEYKIIGEVAKGIVQMIVFNPDGLSPAYTMAGASLTTADIIGAEGLLGGEATNPVLITTRATAAALKAAALSAGYAYDPFDGMEVIYVDSTALTFTNGNDTYTASAVIADLSGVLANFPDGDVVKFKFDDTTLADADMIRVIGKLYVAFAVVDPGKTVSIQAE